MSSENKLLLPEPDLGYIETDKSRQPAFSARQMREALAQQAQEPSVPHLFEFWWEAHMPQSTQAKAWSSWQSAQSSNNVAVGAQALREDNIDEFDDPRLPHWATGKIDGKLCIGAQLPTRDGRFAGNACIVGRAFAFGEPHWLVLTDAGNMMRLNDSEVASSFYPPQWVMDPATAPGNRK